MTAAFGGSDLTEYREEADRFLAALQEEYYLHFAGLKVALELEPIYERFADLTTIDACEGLAVPSAEVARGAATELWRFACEGYLGSVTREHEERLARLETSLEADVDGEPIGYRMLRPRIANEPDRARRERIEQARVELSSELEPIQSESLARAREAVLELGAASYLELYERFGFRLAELATACRSFLEGTEELYLSAFDTLLRRRLSIGLEEAGRFDIPRVLRAPEHDDLYPAERLLPALEGTLAGLGIDLAVQRNVHLDVEARPTKSPRAFCAPIEVPGRIMLVIQPIGGLDDWRALFHEAGHTEHFAHVSSHLPFEARRLGDNAVSEAWAFLLEHLVTEPAWLARRLDVSQPAGLPSESATVLLYYLRRYCAKLLYEVELHAGGELDAMRDRYVEWMREATKLEYSPVDFLADVDLGFYVSSYLRAWALEAGVAAHLRDRFGTGWFGERKAGSLLRELWSEGQGLDADQLAREVTGGPLSLEDVADRIAQVLKT
jgi:hypothetical protein